MGLKESGLRGSIRNVSTGIGAAISIDTLEAEDVGEDSATIRGEITELTNFGEDAEVFFEWGEITQGLPNTTDIQLQDTVGVFTEDLTNLSEDTTHEFQAFGSVRDVSDDGVVLTFETGSAIPDPDVYLDDDWGDNRLTDREDSGTTTYNDVEGVYRPEWTNTITGFSNPTAADGKIICEDDEGVTTPINLNLDETIEWLFNDVDMSEAGTGGTDGFHVCLFAEQNSDTTNATLEQGYHVYFNRGTADVRLVYMDENGDRTDIIQSGQAFDDVQSWRVTRQPNGEWELFDNSDDSQGTETDTQSTNPQYAAVIGRDGVIQASMSEYKVS